MLKSGILLFSILFATLSFGQTPGKVLQLDPNRTIAVVGDITEDQAGRLVDMAMMALTNNEPINILIDSPGGLVSGGDLLLQAMEKLQSRGVVIRCVAKRAESMAMFILGACNERYALPGSVYLWHPVKAWVTNAAISAEEAESMAAKLRELDEKYNPALQDKLALSDEEYHKAWQEEREWKDTELEAASPRFMQPIDAISGAEFPVEQVRIKFPF